MTREEKEQRIQKHDGKAFENYNIEIRQTYLNPKYTVLQQTVNTIGSTGWLEVFQLLPSDVGPSFSGRWDGGSREKGKEERNALDIDILGVSAKEVSLFRNGRSGFSGHHPVKLESDRGHVYQVSIRIPSEKVFEGTVCFNVLRKMGFEASTKGFSATLDKKATRTEKQ